MSAVFHPPKLSIILCCMQAGLWMKHFKLSEMFGIGLFFCSIFYKRLLTFLVSCIMGAASSFHQSKMALQAPILVSHETFIFPLTWKWNYKSKFIIIISKIHFWSLIKTNLKHSFKICSKYLRLFQSPWTYLDYVLKMGSHTRVCSQLLFMEGLLNTLSI